jgi:hypothetical protein
LKLSLTLIMQTVQCQNGRQGPTLVGGHTVADPTVLL